MRALWLENNKISLRDVAQPHKDNEALIKIRKAGICSTDLELVRGYYPYTGILGHEFVGEVVSLTRNPSPIGRGEPFRAERSVSGDEARRLVCTSFRSTRKTRQALPRSFPTEACPRLAE